MLPYSTPNILLSDLDRHNQLLLEGRIDPDETVVKFEEEVASRLNLPANFVVATGSATAALELTYRLCGPGRFQLPFFTWASTYSVLPLNARVWYPFSEIFYNRIFPDCSVMPTVLVELWGLRLLKQWRYEHLRSCRIILDASQNLLDPLHRDFILNPFIESYVIYSFGPIKQITTGRGGVVISKKFADSHVRERAQAYLDSGTIGQRRVLNVGRNLQMTAPSAALGLAQLSRFEEMQEHRQKILGVYKEALGEYLITKPDHSSGHLAVLQLPSISDKERIVKNLYKKEVLTGTHYTLEGQVFSPPITDFPNDISLSRLVLTIPCHCRMTVDNAEDIANIIREAL